MIVSANELESRVLKAVRGAGLAWGLAEEAAAAATWLARADLLLFEPLIARLEAVRPTSAPALDGQSIRPAAAGTALCPILAGAWVADQAITCQRLEVRDVLAPLWLLAVAACGLRQRYQLVAEWEGVRLVLSRAGPLEAAHEYSSRLSAVMAGSVSLTVQRCAEEHRTDAAHGGVVVADEDWQALQTLEQHTYVPASEQSRLAGAGAGVLDSD